MSTAMDNVRFSVSCRIVAPTNMASSVPQYKSCERVQGLSNEVVPHVFT